jgi:hypothetical protein
LQRVVAIFLVCFGLMSPAAAKALRTTGNEVFCVNAHDLMDYAAAVSSKSEADQSALPGCMKLKKGLRYRVLSEEPDQPAHIRVERGRGAVEGYTISIGR